MNLDHDLWVTHDAKISCDTTILAHLLDKIQSYQILYITVYLRDKLGKDFCGLFIDCFDIRPEYVDPLEARKIADLV